MVFRSERKEENLEKVESFLNDIEVIGIDQAISSQYGRLKAKLFNKYGPRENKVRSKTKLHEIGFQDNDIWIAAVAIEHNLTVVSKDGDFVRIKKVVPDLNCESWLE